MPDVEALAEIRPDDWNLALFVHVLGAMVAVGGLVLALVHFAAAWRGRAPESLRAGYRALLWWGLPGFILMRGGAQWIYAEENWDEADPEPAWLGVGWAVGDPGLLLLLIATIVSGVASRRAAAAPAEGAQEASGAGAARVAAIASALLLVAYLVAVWAMTTKPV